MTFTVVARDAEAAPEAREGAQAQPAAEVHAVQHGGRGAEARRAEDRQRRACARGTAGNVISNLPLLPRIGGNSLFNFKFATNLPPNVRKALKGT